MKHKLRLIEGSSKNPRLFTGYTKPCEWMKFTLNWYVEDRKSPISSYETLIAGYQSLADWQKIEARFSVDEHFTLNEVKQLEFYLKARYNAPLTIAEKDVPFKGILQHDEPLRRRFFSYRLNQDLDRQGDIFFRLADFVEADHEYSLSFSVYGTINVVSVLFDAVLDDSIAKRRRANLMSDYCDKCGALKGTFHMPGCDVERGPYRGHHLGLDAKENEYYNSNSTRL